jgi:hypothetical protein
MQLNYKKQSMKEYTLFIVELVDFVLCMYVCMYVLLTQSGCLGSYSDQARDWKNGIRFPIVHGIFLFPGASRPDMEPNQSSVQWVPRALSPAVNCRGVKLTTHLHLVRRLIIRDTILHVHIYFQG